MSSKEPKISAAEARKLRLSQALRENMKRRKQQSRGRADDGNNQINDLSDDANSGDD